MLVHESRPVTCMRNSLGVADKFCIASKIEEKPITIKECNTQTCAIRASISYSNDRKGSIQVYKSATLVAITDPYGSQLPNDKDLIYSRGYSSWGSGVTKDIVWLTKEEPYIYVTNYSWNANHASTSLDFDVQLQDTPNNRYIHVNYKLYRYQPSSGIYHTIFVDLNKLTTYFKHTGAQQSGKGKTEYFVRLI